MILLDSDVLVDLLRRYPPALAWFDTLSDEEELVVSGYVVMELVEGCRNKLEQRRVEREIGDFGVAWLSPSDCDEALRIFTAHHLSHNAGFLDALIGQTALTLDVPLHTFNRRHYDFIPGLQTVQPYPKQA